MTFPVPNMQTAIAKVKDGYAYLLPPWNSFLQQLVQAAPAVANVTVTPFIANANGTVIFSGVAPSIALQRGIVSIDMTGERVIPISIGDIVSWTGTPTIQFLGA